MPQRVEGRSNTSVRESRMMRSNIVHPSEQEIERFASPLLSCLQKHYMDEDMPAKNSISPGIGFSDLQSNLPEEIGGGFVAAVSLHDTNTLFVSSGITRTLGYQQDMLIGQSLLGYLYPRDRLTFVSFLSQGLQARFSPSETTDKFVFYVRIREYKGLRAGFEVAGAKSSCKPFQLKCSIKDITLDQAASKTGDMETAVVQTICFIIVAIPLISAHKLSEERNPAMVPFCTRHTPSCHFSHIDPAGLPFLGYFPQDIIGHPIFDFYHQDDLILIREVYDIIIKQEGSFLSKPYRFKIFNGDYIILETEWSCFINPWSKKFEFIVGQHRIVQGPVNIDVFTETDKTNRRTNDQVMMKKAEEEISSLLSQPVKRVIVHQKDQRMLQEKTFKRKRTLAARVTELIESGKNDGYNEGKNDILSSDEASIWSDKESVLVGVISPHRENSEDLHDQRLQDNIERFFASQPKTICPSSSTGSSSQNQSPDGSGSNDGSSSNNNKSSNDSAFQSGSCGDGVTRDGKMDESNNDHVTPVQSSEHSTRMFMDTLTEEMLAQHDRLCQRQMRKGQCQSQLLHHSKSALVNEDSACMNNKKKSGKDQTKSKKRLDNSKNGITTLDEMFKNTSFAIQPPFAFGFTPFVLGSPPCHSCTPGSEQQPQQQQQRHQHVLVPVMCSVPICSSTMSLTSSSHQSSHQGNPMTGTSMSRSVRVQTESTSPVRHMSPFEREDCQVIGSGFRKDQLVSSAEAEIRSKESMTEGSFESTSFASSSGGEESSGRDHPAIGGGVASPGNLTLDQILMETPVKSEVPAPWISDAPEYSDEVIFRFHLKEISPVLPDILPDQPDLVRRQFNLLRKEKNGASLAEALGESDSQTDFKEADPRDFAEMIGEDL